MPKKAPGPSGNEPNDGSEALDRDLEEIARAPLQEIGPPPPGLELGGEDAPDAPDEGMGDLGAVQPAFATDPIADLGEERRGRGASRITPLVVSRKPSIYVRMRAYMARRPEVAQVTNEDEQMWLYLEVATFQHAEEDRLRPPDQRLYDWGALYMQDLQQALDLELAARTQAIREEAARGERAALKALVASSKDIHEALRRIEEMERHGS